MNIKFSFLSCSVITFSVVGRSSSVIFIDEVHDEEIWVMGGVYLRPNHKINLMK